MPTDARRAFVVLIVFEPMRSLDRSFSEGRKKFIQGSPLSGVEIVQQRGHVFVLEALIAKVLPHVGPPKESFGQVFPSMWALSFL